MDRQQWVLLGVALVVGAIVSIAVPGIYGVLIAVVLGLGLGWAGSRMGLIKGDDDEGGG
jgi:hypothetical protein